MFYLYEQYEHSILIQGFLRIQSHIDDLSHSFLGLILVFIEEKNIFRSLEIESIVISI